MVIEKFWWARLSHISGYISLTVSFVVLIGTFWLQLEGREREKRNLELAEQTAGHEVINSQIQRLADKREQVADDRQKRADDREHQADERAKLADQRDRSADERDKRTFSIALLAAEREQKAFEIQRDTFQMDKKRFEQEQSEIDRDRRIAFLIDRESIAMLKASFKDCKPVKLNLTNASKSTLPLDVKIVTSGCFAHPGAHFTGELSYAGITQSMKLDGYTVKVDTTANYSFFIHSGGVKHPDSVVTIELNGINYAQYRFVWDELLGEYTYRD